MKMAVPNLSKDAVLAWLLDHCEKLLGGIVLLLAVWLAWGGLSAVRSKSAPADLKPPHSPISTGNKSPRTTNFSNRSDWRIQCRIGFLRQRKSRGSSC
jgi:hypothetical protein